MAATTDPNAVYYSYRGVGTNTVVQKFIDLLDKKGIPHRGSESEPIDGSLTNFEEEIGRANITVIFYSQEYFESEHCMNEYACILKNETKACKEATYYVKCGDYDINGLVKFWGGQQATIKNKQFKLTPIEDRSLANGCYLDTTTLYCVQNLDDYFSDKARYKEDTLQTLVNKIADKRLELSNKNTTANQSVTTSSAPSFRIPTTQTKLVNRDNLVEKLHELVSNNNFANLYGFGGSGKTSLVYLYLDEYRTEYNQIAYVVVNNNIKADFVSQINDTIHILKPEDEIEKGLENNQKMIKDAETERNKPDRYKTVIEYLESNYKSDKPNLVILDINNADDAVNYCEDLANNTLQSNKIYPDGWKYLILSRTNIYKGPATLNLNENEKDNTSFLKDLFLKNAGDKYDDFSDSEFTELFNTIYYSPLMAEQLGIFLHNLPKKSLSEINDILHKDSFKKENRSGITAQNRGEEEKTIIGFLKNLIVFDKLSAGEKILLKHFILWPADYISKDVIWELLAKTFESEKNRATKLKSIIKRYFTTWGIKRIGVFFNKTKRYAVSKLWLWILSIAVWSIAILSITLVGALSDISLFEVVGLSFGLVSMTMYLDDEIENYGCSFRSPLQNTIRIVIVASIAVGSALIPFLLYRIVCLLLAVCSPLIISLFHFGKKVVKVLSSKSYLEDINQDAFTGILLELTKKGILSENEDSNKGYKLHGLIAESLREQIDIPNTDYSDYLDKIKEFAKYKADRFSLYAKCIGHSLGVYKIVVDNSTLFDIAYNLHTPSTADYAAMLYADIISNIKICVWNKQRNTLASAYNNLAVLQDDHLEDYDSAKANYEKAIAIREQLPKDNPEYQNNLAGSYNNLAVLQEDHLGDYESAKANYEKAIAIREQLPKDNPEYQNVLACAYNNLAVLQRDKLDDYDSAKANYENAIAIYEQLPKDNPEYRNDLASAYTNLAKLQKYHLDDYDSAKANYEKAIEIQVQLPKDNPEYQNDLASAYNNLAYTYDKLGNYDKAIAAINSAIDIASKLKETDSKYLIKWVGYRHSLSEIKFNNGKDLDEVKNTLLEIQPLAQQCLKDNPDDEWTKAVNDEISDLLSKIE